MDFSTGAAVGALCFLHPSPCAVALFLADDMDTSDIVSIHIFPDSVQLSGIYYAGIAQSVERAPDKRDVDGSNPSTSTTKEIPCTDNSGTMKT